MASVNKVILIGNVGQDPKVFESKTKIVKFSLATTDSYSKETSWHNLTAFGKTAELVEKYVKKGNALYLEGKIQYSEFTTKEGEMKQKTEIIINNIQFLGGKQQQTEQNKVEDFNVNNIKEEDLPF